VGCAYGDFLRLAQDYGFDVSGVEIQDSLAEAARQRGFVVYGDTLEKLMLPRESFDAVTLWDVVEHVGDPRSLLAEAACLLKPGGVLLVHTGNAAFQVPKGRVLAALHPDRGPYNAPVHHFCHFSVKTFRALLQLVGKFEYLEFSHLDTVRYPRKRKYTVMKTYNEIARLLSRLGLPLWTSSLVVFACKATQNVQTHTVTDHPVEGCRRMESS
jgi:2-polyprenyl-3-methyl-5-hydroxy-6-metoxy-1,4-benzoquinol methylase